MPPNQNSFIKNPKIIPKLNIWANGIQKFNFV